MSFVHLFAGNPLLPGKRERLSTEAAVSLLNGTDKSYGTDIPAELRTILPLSEGRPLVVASSKSCHVAEGDVTWRLAWHSAKELGFGISPSGELGEYDKLVYLGERDGKPYFCTDVGSLSRETKEGEERRKEGSEGRREGRREGEGEGEKGPEDLVQSLTSGCTDEDGFKAGFVDLRTLMVAADWTKEREKEEVAIAGHARAILEWHKTSQFCGKCGTQNVPIEAGNRRQCVNSSCKLKAYPRIDPVVIMLVIDKERNRAVLGRQSRFLPRMWSCLAGFMEPGESLEEAVRRETREEVGLEIGEMVYHSSQPWPVGQGTMSCQLMIGFFAFAKNFDIVVDKKELEDARWHTQEEVKEGLTFSEYRENQQLALTKLYGICHGKEKSQGWSKGDSGKPKTPFYAPGPYAIAHHLIKTWADLDTNGLLDLSSHKTHGILSKV